MLDLNVQVVSVAGCLGYDVLAKDNIVSKSKKEFQLLVV